MADRLAEIVNNTPDWSERPAFKALERPDGLEEDGGGSSRPLSEEGSGNGNLLPLSSLTGSTIHCCVLNFLSLQTWCIDFAVQLPWKSVSEPLLAKCKKNLQLQVQITPLK